MKRRTSFTNIFKSLKQEELAVDGIVIGDIHVGPSNIVVAEDSSFALKQNDYATLHQRLEEDGFLAFSNFFSATDVRLALNAVEKVLEGTKKGFDCNLSSGESIAMGKEKIDPESLKRLANHEALEQLRQNERLRTMLRNVFDVGKNVEVPENFVFELPWIRAKVCTWFSFGF